MRAPPSDAVGRVACVPGWGLAVRGDVIVARTTEGTRAWSMETGAELWRMDFSPVAWALDGAEVHALRADEERVAVVVFDARSGVVRRTVALERVAPEGLTSIFAVLEGAYLLASRGVLQRVSVVDGAPLAEAPISWRPLSLVWSAAGLCVSSDVGVVTSLARDTLARQWTRDAISAVRLLAAGEVIVASPSDTFDDEEAQLHALDARTGETLWRDETFVEALASSDATVLLRARNGWVAARDARSGETRWRQWCGLVARAAARVRGGFAVLTDDALIHLGDDGTELVRWPVTQSMASVAAGATGVDVACGAAEIGAAEAGRGVAPELVTRAIEVVGPADPLPIPGRGPMAPAYARLDEARAVLRTVTDLDEAWEALAARGVIPHAWIDDPRRRFGSDDEPTAWHARPQTAREMLAFAGDVEGVERVESLWREALRRFAPWVGEVDDVARWTCLTREIIWSSEGGMRLPCAAAWRALVASLSAEAYDAIERMIFEGNSTEIAREFDLRMADATWRTAARAGLSTRVSATSPHAIRFDERENPYDALRAIIATGYMVDVRGYLIAPRFDDALDALEVIDDDIPF